MRTTVIILIVAIAGCFSSCRKNAVMRDANYEGVWWKYTEDCSCWYYIVIRSDGYGFVTGCDDIPSYSGRTKATKSWLKVDKLKFTIIEEPTAITSVEQGCYGEIAAWRIELQAGGHSFYSGVYYKNE